MDDFFLVYIYGHSSNENSCMFFQGVYLWANFPRPFFRNSSYRTTMNDEISLLI